MKPNSEKIEAAREAVISALTNLIDPGITEDDFGSIAGGALQGVLSFIVNRTPDGGEVTAIKTTEKMFSYFAEYVKEKFQQNAAVMQ